MSDVMRLPAALAYRYVASMLTLLLAVWPSRALAILQCPDGAPPPCRGAAAAAPANSVAVLYFESRSSDTGDLGTPTQTNWDVAPDGQHFVMVRTPDSAIDGTPMHVILHWFDQLRASRER